jgi:formylglycine-generating enzyme required for sulfatase activity
MNPTRRHKPIYAMNGHYPRVFFYFLLIGCLVVCTALQTHAAVKGEVTSVEKGYVRIDVGTEAGLKVGDQGKVYYTVRVGEERKSQPIYVASFTITGAFKNSSVAKIEEAQGEVKVGYVIELTGKAKQATTKKPPPKKVVKRKSTTKSTVQAGQVWRDPHLRMSFAWVPGGCFEMGCGSWSGDCGSAEKPLHRVCVNGFWMARHEVTQDQWKRLMGYSPSDFRQCGSQCPVENVSWNDALEFAQKLSSKTGYTFRLPTEAEWEYACRSGGKNQKYAGGETPNTVAWYKDNAGRAPHHVGRKSPNGLGIYDMSGNVWEWCLDVYDKKAYDKAIGTLRNPVFIGAKYADIYDGDSILRILQGISGYRSVRGGSWGNTADHLRCSDRIKGNPDRRRDWLGFRLVREEIKK